MKRRLFLLSIALLPERLAAGIWGYRLHTLAQMRCRGGMMMYLMLRGEVWKLNTNERKFVESVVETMSNFG